MIQATLPRRAAGELDLNQLARQALQPWADAYDSWRTGMDTWNSGVSDLLRRSAKSNASQCGCPVCRTDPCACRCCVTDADLVVEARVGERRVIPIVVENRWRRERDIELELSSWTKTSDDIQVSGEVLGEAAFKLAPCGEAQVVLVVTIGGEGAGPNDERRQLPDTDRCVVSYADLRIKGCDLRSIRIAVAVLPRNCEAYTVDCACGCC